MMSVCSIFLVALIALTCSASAGCGGKKLELVEPAPEPSELPLPSSSGTPIGFLLDDATKLSLTAAQIDELREIDESLQARNDQLDARQRRIAQHGRPRRVPEPRKGPIPRAPKTGVPAATATAPTAGSANAGSANAGRAGSAGSASAGSANASRTSAGTTNAGRSSASNASAGPASTGSTGAGSAGSAGTGGAGKVSTGSTGAGSTGSTGAGSAGSAGTGGAGKVSTGSTGAGSAGGTGSAGSAATGGAAAPQLAGGLGVATPAAAPTGGLDPSVQQLFTNEKDANTQAALKRALDVLDADQRAIAEKILADRGVKLAPDASAPPANAVGGAEPAPVPYEP